MKIIDNRAAYTETFLKKNEKREKLWIKLKDVELGEYTGAGNPQTTINKIRAHDFKLKSLYVLIKKDTPLNRLTVYDGLSNWYGCGEFDQGKEVFIHHARLNHKGKAPKNSCINRPIWYDWVKFINEEQENLFNYSQEELASPKVGS